MTPPRAEPRSRLTRPRLRGGASLAQLFLVANLVVVVIASVGIGVWVGFQVERSVLDRNAAVTALYIESFVEPQIAGLATSPTLPPASLKALDGLLTQTQLGTKIVAFRIWNTDGVIVYSPDRTLIGLRFPPKDELETAINGQVSTDMSDLSGAENGPERAHWSRLVETYVPVRERGGPNVIAIAEFYQLPDELDAEIGSARFASWAVVAVAALVSYLLLAGIVKRGSDTIIRQDRALRDRVDELTRLLDQNERLHERLRLAVERSTTLNEAALRRTGSDLHDGPAQALSLALLRLEEIEDRSGVSDAVSGAMEDLRLIASGLRSPVFDGMPLGDVASRAVREHERRTGRTVSLAIEALPPSVPVVTKIALYRVLQEALSNARRHAGAGEISVALRGSPDEVVLEVADRGPGFDRAVVRPDALGVAGMRERAELLGGSFEIEPRRDGPGTVVRLTLPLRTGASA